MGCLICSRKLHARMPDVELEPTAKRSRISAKSSISAKQDAVTEFGAKAKSFLVEVEFHKNIYRSHPEVKKVAVCSSLDRAIDCARLCFEDVCGGIFKEGEFTPQARKALDAALKENHNRCTPSLKDRCKDMKRDIALTGYGYAYNAFLGDSRQKLTTITISALSEMDAPYVKGQVVLNDDEGFHSDGSDSW